MNKTENTTGFSQKEVLLWGTTILLAVVLGKFLDVNNPLIQYLTLPAFLVLRLLVALAIPMFFLVIIHNLITLKFPGKTWYRLLLPLLSNTTFAILIGFVVVNLIQPGKWADLIPFEFVEQTPPTPDFANIDNFWHAILELLENLVPTSLIEPLINNNVMQIIVVAFSLGIVLRAIKSEQKQQELSEETEEDNPCPQGLENLIQVLFQALKSIWDLGINFVLNIYDWVKSLLEDKSKPNPKDCKDEKNNNTDGKNDEKNNIDFQPLENVIGVLLEAVKKIWTWVVEHHLLKLAVFGILLKNIAVQGVTPLLSLVLFVLTMLVALFLQACYYLLRIKFGSNIKPIHFLREGREVFTEAFTTASSSETLNTARNILKDKILAREASVRLWLDIASKFNRDGTIILMVTSILYISQMLGENLSIGQYFILILTCIFASIGGIGIPNAALVILTLVFTAIGKPIQIDYIALIVAVDWFLDRFYTVINVMGYMTVTVLLECKK